MYPLHGIISALIKRALITAPLRQRTNLYCGTDRCCMFSAGPMRSLLFKYYAYLFLAGMYKASESREEGSGAWGLKIEDPD